MKFLESIPYSSLPFLSPLVKDYLTGNEKLKPFHTYEPSMEGALKAANERDFPNAKREILVSSLFDQYSSLDIEGLVKNNIEKLRQENTFTITTGHQLCVYTGPAYFIYKIVSVISIARKLSLEDASKNFIPVFWMASEDHDFDEISEVNFYGKKWKWEKENSEFGKVPVGILNPGLVASWGTEMRQYLRDEPEVSKLILYFEEAYRNNNNLSDATRQIVHELFKAYGLVIIDGNDKKLKTLFEDILVKETTEQCSHASVINSTRELEELGYKGQIASRAINLFYFDSNYHRQRIEKSGTGFLIRGDEKILSSSELISQIKSSPQQFSPNVVLRPVYQETILPNIIYIGGPAEVTYWLQLKGVFDNFNIPFPVVMVRSSFLVLPDSSNEKIIRTGFSISQFLNRSEEDIIKLFIQKNDTSEINFMEEEQLITNITDAIKQKATEVDSELISQIAKDLLNFSESLSRIESKFTKALKQKFDAELKIIKRTKSLIFPENVFQERQINIADCINFTSTSIDELIISSNPFGYQLEVDNK